MKLIREIRLDDWSNEEQIPGFSREFPYVASRVESESYGSAACPWHWHRPVELFYVLRGSLTYMTPHSRFVMPEGAGGLVNPNVLHASQFHPREGCTILLHIFDPDFVAGESGSQISARYVLPLTTSGVEILPIYPDSDENRRILESLRESFAISEESFGYELALRDSLSKIWLSLLPLAGNCSERNGQSGGSDAALKRLILYIQGNYASNLSVDTLAAQAHISRRACFRLFRENLKMSPLEYIRQCRIRQACRLLTETQKPVGQIGEECGFGSGSYFGTVFVECMGIPPAAYRKKAQSQ